MKKLKKLECFIFGHNFKYMSTFTHRSTGNDTGRRFCTNCGLLQFRTKKTLREIIINFIN